MVPSTVVYDVLNTDDYHISPYAVHSPIPRIELAILYIKMYS